MSDTYAVPNKLPGKQVSVLAHRRRRILQDKSVIQQKKVLRSRFHGKKKRSFIRAEAFIMDNIKAVRTQRRARMITLRNSLLKTDDVSEKLLVVMRHAGVHISDKTTNNVLKALRLTKKHQVVFLKNSKENQILLKVVEPFVTFGYPTNSTVRDLIFKHGFAIINGKKTAITSNTMLEENLGENGIICLEDLIHEIFTVGPNFDVATSFICPFMLKNPKDGWTNKVSVSYKRGGEYGNRKNGINILISRCI